MNSNSRQLALEKWLQHQLGDGHIKLGDQLGDASVRCYYRVHCSHQTLIAVDAPQDMNKRFVSIGKILRAQAVKVPQVLAHDRVRGFMLIEDFGQQLYLSALNAETAEDLYAHAFETLLKIQRLNPSETLPRYDRWLLTRELLLFNAWFLDRHCQIKINADQYTIFMDAYRFMIQDALSQPQVFVHRDYHSRNLMVLDHAGPGVLDFQDAVRGPLAYDLVSLLRDCYIDWPQVRIESWMAGYLELLNRTQKTHYTQAEFQRWFDFCGIQRHLKAIGIFARLKHLHLKPGYLKEIPRTLNYIFSVSARYPELKRFRDCLQALEIADIFTGSQNQST